MILMQVSWLRHEGPQPSLLSVGMFVFISDSRLTVMEEPALEDWLLVIDSAREDDTGGYECQVNTVPHTGHTLHLHVVGESLYYTLIGAKFSHWPIDRYPLAYFELGHVPLI